MSSALLLYLLFHAIAVTMCLWAAASAARRIEEHGRSHRLWTFAAATLLPPVTAACVFAMPLDQPLLRLAIAVLPLLVLAATWSNVMTLRDQGVLLKILHLPLFAFNTTLIGLYTVRALQDLGGVDLGDWGTALTGGHTLLQTWIGQPHAEVQPVWLHLPLILPLWLRFTWLHRLALMLCSTVSFAMIAVLLTMMPLAYHRAEGYRKETTSPTSMREGQRVGVELAWAERLMPREERLELRSFYAGLGVSALTVEIGPELFEDDGLLTQTREEIAFAQQRGLYVVVVCLPPLHFGWVPAADIQELNRELAKVHWLTAEKLAPDLLVMYAGPFGRLASACARIGTIEQWVDLIDRATEEVHQANADVEVAVVLDNRGPHAEELFLRLVDETSTIDLVGISLFPDKLTRRELELAISTLDRWFRLDGGDKPIWIMETGACPQSTGGEVGQWNFLAHVLSWTAGHPRLSGVCIDSLIDSNTSRGLLAGNGRPRLAYRRLRDILFREEATPPR